ncbi:hypothetical protein TWF718_009947 [Orbilia javanica]|uniref:CHAT domain-containing protein n=1 Tax=Orbilia javanica TaxID=47235 RepID=A0AAN8MUF7_9PEZI
MEGSERESIPSLPSMDLGAGIKTANTLSFAEPQTQPRILSRLLRSFNATGNCPDQSQEHQSRELVLGQNFELSDSTTGSCDLTSCMRISDKANSDVKITDTNIDVDISRKVLALKIRGPSNQTLRRNPGYQLGLSWYLRYKQTEQRTDYLDKAIAQFQLLALMGATTELRQLGYYHLGVCYHSLFRSTGSLGDLNQAVNTTRSAIDLSRRLKHPDASMTYASLFNLGSCVYQKFLFTTKREDLEAAVDCFNKALKTPGLGPDEECMIRCQLGDSLVMRFGTQGTVEDLPTAESVLRKALRTQGASCLNRACAARSLANKLAYWHRWEDSLAVFEEAVSLIALFDSELTECGHQENIEAFAGLSRDAAAIAINCKRPPQEVLALLERGRGLMSGSFSIKGTAVNKERMLKNISPFLYSSDEAMSALGGDKLAVINVSKYRCDAILMEKGRIEAIPLTLLDYEDIDGKIRTFRNGGESFWGVLEWLWEAIALPVLQGFGICQQSTMEPPSTEDNLPHLWWITTGQLTQVPIHAAGKHFKRSGETVLDRVISSYAVSVTSFLNGRQEGISRGFNMCNASKKALVVPMPNTPGHPPLRFAQAEADVVTNVCRSLNFNIEVPNSPYRKAEILKQLQECQIFHFAGHGLSDPTNPSQSCLLLHDWITSPLTVQSLRQINSHNNPPFLAYLSACSTGSNKVMTLSDESISLISAAQLAGFSNAIGTLWEVNDQHCVAVAKIVYETIAQKGLTNFAVALGLHRASIQLRNEAVSKNRGSGIRNIPSKTSDIAVTPPNGSGACAITKRPNWFNAELKSYRSIPLLQPTSLEPTDPSETIISLPVEIMITRQIPLESDPLFRYSDENRSGQRNMAVEERNEHEADIHCRNDISLRNPVKRKPKPKQVHFHWAPYVHFGI